MPASPNLSNEVQSDIDDFFDTIDESVYQPEIDPVKIWSHKINKDEATVRLKITNRDQFGTTWATEFQVQERDEKLLLDYWHDLGGRDKATGMNEYTVFQLLGDKRRKTRKTSVKVYLVHWTGYSKSNATWETEDYLMNICPDAVDEYMKEMGVHRE